MCVPPRSVDDAAGLGHWIFQKKGPQSTSSTTQYQSFQVEVLQVLRSTQSFHVEVLQVLTSTQSFQVEVLVQVRAGIQSFQVEVLLQVLLASAQSFQVEVLPSTQPLQVEILQAPASTQPCRVEVLQVLVSTLRHFCGLLYFACIDLVSSK